MPNAGKTVDVDWMTRMANARSANPSSLGWHARRRHGTDVDLDSLSDEQLEQLEVDKAIWFEGLRRKSLSTKRRDQAARLRAKADELDKQADELAEGRLSPNVMRNYQVRVSINCGFAVSA